MHPRRFGRYELLEHLATGGMAEVWLARSFGVAGFEKRVVIKRILPGLARSPRFVRLFVQEARISAGLVHPNIVQIYELGRVGEDHYIAMEHVHGHDLTRVQRALRQRGTAVPIALAVHITASLLRGLAHAHALTDSAGRPLHLVHRDVSPHNVMVGFQGEVKLLDFGIARLVGEAEPEASGRPGGGKFAYMAPEQASGAPVDRRSDIFSAGVVLYEMLVGKRLFDDAEPAEKLRRVRDADVPDPRALRPDIPDALWAVLQGLLERAPEDRPARAEEAEEALRAVLYDLGERADAATLVAFLAAHFGPVPPPGGGVDVAGLAEDVRRLREDATRSDPASDPARVTASDTPSSGLDELRAAPGECKAVVVLVADVIGMTDLSAQLDPELVVRRHLRLLRRLRRSVGRHGGRVDRFQDDTLIVFFGVPHTGEDDLDRALACAVDLHRQAARLEQSGLSVRLAIGVHRGEVTLGGSRSRRLRYLARGDTVKLARHLSLEADAGETLVSDAVGTLASDRWRLAEGRPLRERGSRESSPTWALEGRGGTTERAAGRWVPRQDEVAVLGDALAALARGEGGALWVRGEAGTGKSRLLRELRARARRFDVPVFAGRAAPYTRDRPLAPFRDLVAEALAIEPEASRDEVRERLTALAELGLDPRQRRILAGLFAVEIGGRPPGGPPGQVADAAVAFVRGLSRDRPVLLALEDVQHLLPDERALIGRVVEACQDRPIVFLLTSRDAPPAWLVGPRWQVALEPLDADRLAGVAAEAVGVRRIGAALHAVLADTCEGNPLYAATVVRALQADDRLLLDGDSVDLRDPARPLALPPGLDGLIAARVDALPPRCKAALQVAASIGPTFSPALLRAAVGATDLQDLVTEMAERGLVVFDPDGSTSFVSSLVWDVVRRSILAARGRECHAMVAHGIFKLHAGELDAHRHALARHLAQAGRFREAAEQEREGAELLERQQLVHEAARAWERAVGWLGREEGAAAAPAEEGWLRLRAGEAHALAGEPRRAELHLQLALDLAEDALHPEVEARVQLALGRVYRSKGQLERAARHFEAALEQVGGRTGGPPAAWVREVAVHARLGAGHVRHDRGDLDGAQAAFRAARLLAEGDAGLEAQVLVALALQPIRAGEAAAALPLLEAARVAAEAAGDRILAGRVVNNIGAVHYGAGRYDAALDCFRAALDLRQGLGYREGVVTNLHNVADTLLRLGQVSRAWASFAHSREIAVDGNWARGVAMNDVYLAYIDGLRGDAGALGRLQDATRRARELGDRETATAGVLLEGRLLAERGEARPARSLLLEARSEAVALGARVLSRDADASLAGLPG